MTAVIRRADAVRQAWTMISSSMRPSLMSPGAVDCNMKTAREAVVSKMDRDDGGSESGVRTIFVSYRLANRYARLLIRIVHTHSLRDLDAEPFCRVSSVPSHRSHRSQKREREREKDEI